MSKNGEIKSEGQKSFAAFRNAKDGGVSTDRKKLHESPEYKRQVSALAELSRQMAARKS
ncbi:hypothetical protein FHW69_001040 [Luteibacter sp. Sphag1AF]|nr:hypothetical protein [Luteibacter sp. Sphag1AF]